MKTIGLIGGMSYKSTLEYYRIINQETNRILGKSNSGKILLYSFNFNELEPLFKTKNWQAITKKIIDIAFKLEVAGADCILLLSNTTHIIASEVEKAINVRLIHIVKSVEKELKQNKIKKVALLGTKYTLESNLYKNNLPQDIKIIKPSNEQINYINKVIYNELILGEFRENSRNEFKKIITELKSKGAEGVILGCTEISLLIKPNDICIPVFDSTKIHALDAVKYMLHD
ncbi:MAG: amino acid racemase [Candidatus Izemoplasmatales bacterium]